MSDCIGLQALPDSLGDLAALTLLKLDQCQLAELPDSLVNLAALRQLIVNDRAATYPSPSSTHRQFTGGSDFLFLF